MATPRPYSNRELTNNLRKLAAQAESTDDDGNIIDKGAKLAELLWKKALGYTELDPKTGKDEFHRPESWAILLIYERLEGKTPVAMPDENASHKVGERVSELAKGRLNALATAAAGATGPTLPSAPTFKRKET